MYKQERLEVKPGSFSSQSVPVGVLHSMKLRSVNLKYIFNLQYYNGSLCSSQHGKIFVKWELECDRELFCAMACSPETVKNSSA